MTIRNDPSRNLTFFRSENGEEVIQPEVRAGWQVMQERVTTNIAFCDNFLTRLSELPSEGEKNPLPPSPVSHLGP